MRTHVRIDSPQYYKGLIDGTVTATRAPRGLINIGGSVAVSSARIPLTALFNPSSSKAPSGPALPIGFDNLRARRWT